MDPKKREQEFLAKLLETFQIEAEEHVKTITDGLLALERNDSKINSSEVIETIYREAHSLKGAARAVNHSIIQEITQSYESVLSAYKDGKISSTASFFDTLLNAMQVIKNFIQKKTESISEDEKNLIQQTSQSLEALTHSDIQPKELFVSAEVASISHVQPHMNHSKELVQPSTIRVSIQKMDKLLQEVEELLLLKLSTAKSAVLVNQLQSLIKEWEKIRILPEDLLSESHSFKPSRLTSFMEYLSKQNVLFDSLSFIIETCSKTTAQDAHLASSLVDTLLENTKSILLQPFQILLESFPLMVREISHSLGKEIKLEMKGAEIEIDRRVLEELKDPLLHLIRNSIDHGIEQPKERAKANKPIAGTLTVSAEQIGGNLVQITVSDDGKGMDSQKLKEAALKEDVLPAKEIEEMSDKEALNLAFLSGISTSPTVTELSGRGLGMKIVAEKVEKLGGSLHIDTEQGKGTAFIILVPITLGTFRGIQVCASGQDFIIPTSHVVRALHHKLTEICSIEGHETIHYEGQTLIYWKLGELLNITFEACSISDSSYTLIIKAADAKIALGVDQVLAEQELFIKSFGKLLPVVRFFTAATVLENGKVIPVLDPFDLIAEAKQQARTYVPKATISQKKEKQKTILVVEDSITARILLKNILTSAGFIVKTAVNGEEAFTLLKAEQVDLLMTDVEMPEMDGFELAEKVRGDEKLKNLPIIICTSKNLKADREKGISIGANAYIEKSSFMQSSLLDIIQKLL